MECKECGDDRDSMCWREDCPLPLVAEVWGGRMDGMWLELEPLEGKGDMFEDGGEII